MINYDMYAGYSDATQAVLDALSAPYNHTFEDVHSDLLTYHSQEWAMIEHYSYGLNTQYDEFNASDERYYRYYERMLRMLTSSLKFADIAIKNDLFDADYVMEIGTTHQMFSACWVENSRWSIG